MKKVTISLLTLAILVLPVVASAQVTIRQSVGLTFNLGTSDLESSVIKILQWVLGFLGLIAVIFILYGGLIWMTAGGNEEKVSKAKKILTAAVIGLVVVLIAWAIVTFVVSETSSFTS